MKLKLNSKPLFVIVCVFAFVSLLDVFTAMFILPYEANPIYLMTKSVSLLWGLKILLIVMVMFIYFSNRYEKQSAYFSFVYILLLGIILFGLGVYSNVNGMLNQEVINYNAGLSTDEKIGAYSSVILFFMIIPYIFGVVAFEIYNRTVHQIRLKPDKDKHDIIDIKDLKQER